MRGGGGDDQQDRGQECGSAQVMSPVIVNINAP